MGYRVAQLDRIKKLELRIKSRIEDRIKINRSQNTELRIKKKKNR